MSRLFLRLKKVLIEGLALLHIHPDTQSRKLLRHLFVPVITGQTHHAGNHRGVFQSNGGKGKRISGKGPVFVSDERRSLLQRLKQPAPLFFLFRKIRFFFRSKRLFAVGPGIENGGSHRQAARNPGQKFLVSLVQILPRKMHLIAGTVCAADEQPSQNPAVFFPVIQQMAHHPVRIRHLHAAHAPEGEVGLQRIGAFQISFSLFGVRQTIIRQNRALFHRPAVRVSVAQTGPGVEGSYDAAVAEEVLVNTELQNPGQGLHASRVRIFQNLLSQPLLQARCKQKLQQLIHKLFPAADDHRTDDSGGEKHLCIFPRHSLPDHGTDFLVPPSQLQRQPHIKAPHPVVGAGQKLLHILIIGLKVQTARQIRHSPGGMIAEVRRAIASAPHGRGKLSLHPYPGDFLHILRKLPVRQRGHSPLQSGIPEFLHGFQILQRLPVQPGQFRIKLSPSVSSIGIRGIIPQGLCQRSILCRTPLHRFLLSFIQTRVFSFHRSLCSLLYAFPRSLFCVFPISFPASAPHHSRPLKKVRRINVRQSPSRSLTGPSSSVSSSSFRNTRTRPSEKHWQAFSTAFFSSAFLSE